MSRMISPQLLASTLFVFVSVLVGSANAQDRQLVDLYGQGVHAYYRSDFDAAQKFLELAVEEGSKDPRAYYFLGLSNMVLGNTEEAEVNFTSGAELELDGTQSYNIGKALERVQGPERLMLEQFRSDVRTAIYLRRKAWEKKRYDDLKTAEAEVLRDRSKQSDTKPPVDIPAEDPTDPFPGAKPSGVDDIPEATEPVEESAAPRMTVPSPTDPFGKATPSNPVPVPANTPDRDPADPFSKPAPKAADPFAPEPESTDPFGAAAPASSDPFGSAEPAQPADMPMNETTDTDPLGASAPEPASDNDPFGADSAAPADSPAPADSDPFGAAAPVPAAGANGGSSSKNPVYAAFHALGKAMVPNVNFRTPAIPGVPQSGNSASSPPAPMPRSMPADTDPFGPSETDTNEATSPAMDSSDPFSPPAPASDNPFGNDSDPFAN